MGANRLPPIVDHAHQSWQHTFDLLHRSNSSASADTFASLLKSCGNSQALSHGRFVHHCILKSGLDRKALLASLLLQMYEKCGALEDALTLFASMHQRDVFSTNVIIKAHARCPRGQEARQVFGHMLQEALMPNRVTFVYILSAYETIAEGKQMHARIVDSQLESDVVVGTALVNMYGRCGSLDDAKKVFDKMPERNVVSWTTMIAVYARHCEAHVVLQHFHIMQQEGVSASTITFVSLLAACAGQAALADGKLVHALILDSQREFDIFVETALVNMYGKCGSLTDAQSIFLNMPVRNVVSWTAMISAYAHQGKPKEALEVLDQMFLEGVKPNKVTYVSVLAACASDAALDKGKRVHACILNSGSESDRFVGTALFNMYGKCGSMEDAQIMFDRVSGPNVVSWNAMIVLYTEHGQGKEALKLFAKMQQVEVIPDNVTFLNLLSACTSLASVTEGKRIHSCILDHGLEKDVLIRTALISMYGKCGNVDESARIFNKMPHLNIFSWNAMIAAYVQDERGRDALQVFDQMQLEGVMQDNVTFISSLSACAGTAALAEGKRIHVRIVGSECEVDVVMGNSLISMYGKCGSMRDAHRLFDEMPERNAVSWSAMIAAYSQHGHAKDSLQLFGEMQQRGVVPNSITFVCVLTACSHAGLLDEGCQFFTSMIRDYGIMPTVDHYNCMIDLLGRAGLLDEAEDLIKRMPDEPTVVSWTTLLGACRNLADFARGERAAKQLFQLDAEDAAPYIALSNLLTAAGKEEDAGKVIDLMRDKILMPTVATGLLYSCSWDRSLEGKM